MGACTYPFSPFAIVFEAAGIVAGGHDKICEKICFYAHYEPAAPLVHSASSLRRLIRAVDSGIPIVHAPMPMAGGV